MSSFNITLFRKYLFLFDGVGALVSALLLCFLIAPREDFFGFPANVAEGLAILPCIYTLYSLVCFVFSNKDNVVLIRMIIVANLFYCGLSLFLVLKYFDQITLFGLMYFLSEKIIILALVYWEEKIVQTIRRMKKAL